VILMTLDNATQGELQRYENNYKALNLITITLDKNVYDRVAHLKLFMMSSLTYATLMRALLKLSLHVRILIIGNTKLSIRNLLNL
jgi:hypothetical protein